MQLIFISPACNLCEYLVGCSGVYPCVTPMALRLYHPFTLPHMNRIIRITASSFLLLRDQCLKLSHRDIGSGSGRPCFFRTAWASVSCVLRSTPLIRKR